MTALELKRQQAFRKVLQSARQTMLWSEILRLAIDSFRASKVRFSLTALGMVIGTASVILVVTIGLTGREFILKEIQKIGTNEIELEYGGSSSAGTEYSNYNGFLTADDEQAVDKELPDVQYSSPVLQNRTNISLGGGLQKETLVLGVSPQYRFIRNLIIPYGRFFDDVDDASHVKCAVVTEAFSRLRYGSSNAAVGHQFEINGIPFFIIGVFRESVTDFGESEIAPETILIPYSVARYFTGTPEVKQIYFSMRDMSDVSSAAVDIKRIVRARHSPNSIYETQDLRELLGMAARVSDIVTAVLVLVAAVTLAVGGVGIMNIMLANVQSRFREIGIRKALGATYREIKLQFLTEAIIISLAGGAMGAAIGLVLPLAVRMFTDFAPPVNLWSVLIALSAAAAVGIVFGTLPATTAARLNPVEALRFE